jgi:hypothetical protein
MAEELANVDLADRSPKKGVNPWVIVAIIVVILICCCLAVFVILALLGPAVGTVFSNIIEELGTPVP